MASVATFGRGVLHVAGAALAVPAWVMAAFFVSNVYRNQNHYLADDVAGIQGSALGLAAGIVIWIGLAALFRSTPGTPLAPSVRSGGWGAAVGLAALAFVGLLLVSAVVWAVAGTQLDPLPVAHTRALRVSVGAGAIELGSFVVWVLTARAIVRFARTPASVDLAPMRLGCGGAALIACGALAGLVAFVNRGGLTLPVGFALAFALISGGTTLAVRATRRRARTVE